MTIPLRFASLAVAVGLALAIGTTSTSALASESVVSSRAASVATGDKAVKVPKVVGKSGDKAKKALTAAGFKTKFVAPKGSFVVLSGNWTVKSQKPKAGAKVTAGTRVTLKVVKTAKVAKPVEATAAAPTATAGDPNLPAEFEAELKNQFAVASWTELCYDATLWGCYVAGFAQPVPNTIVATLQIPSDAAGRAMGDGAARAMFALVGKQLPTVKFVQVVAADGTSLRIVGRAEIPLLNQ